MKKAYVKPSIEMETFSPNEYIAACYAIVNAGDPSNFIVSANLKNGPTDGQNYIKDSKYYWNGKGFDDDHLDELSTSWYESDNSWYYNGPGMSHTTEIQVWKANGDATSKTSPKTLVTEVATAVNLVEITEANASDYNTSVNAS